MTERAIPDALSYYSVDDLDYQRQTTHTNSGNSFGNHLAFGSDALAYPMNSKNSDGGNSVAQFNIAHEPVTIQGKKYTALSNDNEERSKEIMNLINQKRKESQDYMYQMGGDRGYDSLNHPVNADAGKKNTMKNLKLRWLFYLDNPKKLNGTIVMSVIIILLSISILCVHMICLYSDPEINLNAYHIAISIILLVILIAGSIIVLRDMQKNKNLSITHHSNVYSGVIFASITLLLYYIALSLSLWNSDYDLNRHNPREFSQFTFSSYIATLVFVIMSYKIPGLIISSMYQERAIPDVFMADNGVAIFSREQIEAAVKSAMDDKHDIYKNN